MPTTEMQQEKQKHYVDHHLYCLVRYLLLHYYLQKSSSGAQAD